VSTKMVRLDTKAENVAKQYGSTVSIGILNMERLLQESKQNVNKGTDNVNKCIPFDEKSYWAKLEETLSKFGFKPKVVVESFKKASDPTFRAIGNIKPGEELEEPIGRQGRELR
jgi:hypothetical protein